MRLDPFSALYGRTPMDTWHRQLARDERVGFDEQLGIWLIVGHDFHLIANLLRYRAGDDARPTEAGVAAIVLNVLVSGWETTAGLIGQARRYRSGVAVRSHLALPADISGSRCPVAHAAPVMSPL
jgi:cytochrome P450